MIQLTYQGTAYEDLVEPGLSHHSGLAELLAGDAARPGFNLQPCDPIHVS